MSQTYTPLSKWIKCPFCGSRYDPAKLEDGNCRSCRGDLLWNREKIDEDGGDYYPDGGHTFRWETGHSLTASWPTSSAYIRRSGSALG